MLFPLGAMLKKFFKQTARFFRFVFGQRATSHWFELAERFWISMLLVVFGVVVNFVLVMPIAGIGEFFGHAGAFGGSFIIAGILSVPISFLFSTTRRGWMSKILSFLVANYAVGIFVGVVVVIPLKASL